MTSDPMVVKDQLDLLGLQGSQAHLDSPAFQNQEVMGCQDSGVLLESLAKKVYLGFLVLKVPGETKALVYLVYQV